MAAPDTLTGLIDSLEAEADAELARQREADRAEVERIRAAARAEAERTLEAAVAAVEADARRTSAAAIGQARARAAARLRDEREAALAAVHAAARERLAGLRGQPGYSDVLAALLAEALAVLPRAEAVHVDPRDREVADRALHRSGPVGDGRPPHGPRVVADLCTDGGGAVSGGGRRVDNTVESRLDAAWPRLRSALVRSWAAEMESNAGLGGPDGQAGTGGSP